MRGVPSAAQGVGHFTLHGDLGDAPPVTLSERDLWKDGKSWELPVRCPETLGALGMISIDDGAGGGVAAKYLKRVVVMRRKSYDPAVIFSNPHSAECEGKPTPFDPKTRILQVMVDPPPVLFEAAWNLIKPAVGRHAKLVRIISGGELRRDYFVGRVPVDLRERRTRR